MSKKSQAQALKEVFQFGFGLVLLILMFYFSYNYLIPIVEDYSLNLHAQNFAEHAHYLIMKVNEISAHSFNSSIEFTYPMPEKIWERSYAIFFQGQEVCCSIQDTNIEKCTALLADSNARGIFFSGGELRILSQNNETYSMITLGN
ncbi:MAG: hypothetical protein PHG04_02965 [Candidatus Nanoarchaeia archaeon]|nr:hypothetical protein [Candidatus Nanoarchaeia archaeon]MDD5054313.1 hypothetical protein [Candidatus Nanoarchaeia archaeon]